MVGVIFASLGHTDLKSAILGVFKLPIVYGVVLALVVKATGFAIPLPLSRTIEIAASGAVPLMIVLLGLELTKIEWSHSFRALGVGVFTRLILGPVVGLVGALGHGLVLLKSQPARRRRRE